jgi:hypothetical protein
MNQLKLGLSILLGLALVILLTVAVMKIVDEVENTITVGISNMYNVKE